LKIAVVGIGYVGLSISVLLAQHNEVVALDIDSKKVDAINRRQSLIEDVEIKEYAALLDSDPVGFLAVMTISGQSAAAVIDLIGVDAKYQRRGVGRALVAKFIESWQSRFDRLMVGTQVTNRSSLALYADVGFRVVNSAYVLHAHVREGIMIQ
jgi:UDP-glucose 6-dehydrogenase